MISKFLPQTNTLDKIIFILILLFAATLTNSIFVNQIGYFFPLFILIFLAIVKKENKFEKNGLELAFILFLSAELISAILSIDREVAFRNFFKRLVLIPIVYTIVAVANDTNKAKFIFKFYLGAALLTMLAYIIFAYEHFIAQLYQVELKGPSPFQYVMTAGGLMSFTTIFLFAFLINEKTKIQIRIFYFIAFCISVIALISSYTRAAWLGTAAGILFILLIKRNWMILIPMIILTVLFLFKNGSVSEVVLYHVNGHRPELIKSISTNGRATDVIPISGDTLILADYDDGIKLIVGNRVIKKIETPSPATRIWHWKDNYFVVYLFDSRQIVIKKGKGLDINVVTDFISPGLTRDLDMDHGKYYVADSDSGLSVYSLENDKVYCETYKNLEGISRVDVNDSTIVVYNSKKSTLNFYTLNGLINPIGSFHINTGVGYLWLYNGNAFFQTEKELMHFAYSNSKVEMLNSFNIQGIYRMRLFKNKIYSMSKSGDLYKTSLDSGEIVFKKYFNCGFSPTDFHISDSTLYLSYNKKNRLLSIFDPYHETNIERINIWKTGFKIFANYPLFGVGDIDLGNLYSQYKDKYLKENFGHMHNNFVHFLVILGSVGFLLAMFMLFKILQLHLKIYNTLKAIPFMSSYALGAAAVFIGFIFSGLGEWNFGDQEIITMVWFTLGINIAFYKSYIKSMNLVSN